MAATSGAIRAGRAFVEFFTDKSPLVKGLKSIEGDLKKWGAKVASIGAKVSLAGSAVAAPFAAAANTFADMGAKLSDMSKRTGASVEALSTLGYAAEQSGASLESVESALTGVRGKIVDAATGGGEAMKAFARLGLSWDELANSSPEDALRKVGAQLNKIPNLAQRASLAEQTLGSADLLPMIGQMDELEKHAREMGFEISGPAADAAKDFSRSLSDLWKTVKMAAFQVGSALAPEVKTAVTAISSAVITATNWAKANKGLIVTVATVAAGIVAAGTAIAVIGTVLTAVGTVAGVLGTIIGALLSPIGLILAAIAGLGYAFVRYTDAGKKALTSLVSVFNDVKADAIAAFGGISDALAAGDIGLAMRVAGSMLKLEWTKAINLMKSKWIDFKFAAIEIAIDLAGGIVKAFSTVVAEVEKVINNIEGMLIKLAAKKKAAEQGIKLHPAALAGLDLAIELKNKVADRKAQQRNGAIDALKNGGAFEALKVAAAGRKKAGLGALQDDLAKAQKEFDDAVEEARRKRKAPPKGKKENRPGIGEGLQGLANNVLGTFSANTRGMFSGSPLNDIKKATQQTAQNTAKIAANAQGMGFN